MTNPTLKTAGNRRDWLLIVLCLFTVTFFVYRDFEVRMLYGYAVLAMILGLHVLCRLWQNRAPGMDPLRMALLLLAAAVLVNFLRPDSRHNSDTISFIISMVICCGFVILSRPSERMGRLALALCFAGAVALTGYIFFFENNPWYFWNWFMPKVSETAAAYTSYYVPKGYSFTLGGCTQTDYTLFLGLAACGGYVTCGRKFDWKSAVASLFGIFFLYSILIVGRRGELLGAAACLAILVLALCGKKQRRFLIIGGIIAGVVGFGAVVVLMSLLPYYFGIVDSPTLALSINLLYTVALLWKFRKYVDLKLAALPTAIYSVLAAVMVHLIGDIEVRALAIALAVLLMALSVYFLAFARRIKVRGSMALGIACSSVAGVTGGLFGVGGPPMVLYFLAAAKDHDTYMGCLQFLFVVTGVVSLGARFGSGMFRAELLPYVAVGIAGTMAGMWLGERICRRLNADAMRVATYIFVGVSGLILLLQQL
jgi:uncharacterized membrane protein YfcA